MTSQDVAIPRRSRLRKWVVLSFGTLALLLGLFWHCVVRQACLGVVQVPGGEVSLVRAVEGRLIYRQSDPIPVWARSYVPGANRLVKPRFYEHIDSADMMPGDRGPWLVFSVESATWPMIPPSLRFDRIEIESAGHVHRGSPLMSFGQILAFRTDSIPRRDPQLKMQLFPTQGNPVSMTVDNPFYRTEFPEWTPGPMPARATRGPFSVELTDIVIANEGGNYPVVNCTCTDPTLEPCHVFANLEDATGNRGPFVSPTESVWKVVAQLGVPVTATSPLNKRFPLGKIQIPPANTLVIWPKSVQDEDLVFQSQAIAGPGTYEMDHGKWKVVNAPKSGNSNGRVRGPAILCDYSRHNYLPGNSETILVQSRNGVRSASCSSYRSRMLSRSKLSTDVTAFSTLDLSEFSPGDEIELAIIRSRTEQFEFLVAPPDKSKSLPFPSYLPLPGD